jgi:hypothetical protein
MKKVTNSMKNMGKGIGNFISNPNAIRSAMGVPASEQTVDVKATSLGSEPIVKAKAQPKTDLVPNPVKSTAITKKRRGRPKKLQTLAQVQADIDSRNQTYRSPITGGLLPVKKSKKVTSLAKGGMDGDDKKKNVDKSLEKDFKVDPKMKKAFSDAMALPAKSAAVALIDLLEKIPAPSKEASKILNRNITKIANAFKLGAASTEVANDEEDNDKDEGEGKSPTLMQALIGKALNAFGGGEKTEGETGGSGATPELPSSSPQQQLMPAQMGDPTTGKRAPYTGTADGIGLGDGGKGTRAMQPIKKRKGLAKKLFGMTPMGMAFNAGAKAFKGMKGLASKASGMKDKIKGAAGKALAASPVGMAMKFGMKALKGVKNIFNPPDEPQQSLTELTDKTIKESREAKDSKTEKLAEGAAGTGEAIANAMGGGGTSMEQEGSELAQPNIEESPFINVYNITSQF